MRTRKALLALALATGGVALVPALGLTQSDAKPDLVVSFASEPPHFEVPGGRWRVTVTVSNQGRARAAERSFARAYLSQGRRVGEDDVRLGGRARIEALPAAGQQTRRMTVRIPRSIVPGRYFLIVCADDGDDVDESNDRHNCSLSGQEVAIAVTPERGRGPQGPPGPPGPQGAKGPTGTAGKANRDIRVVDRFNIPVGDRNVSDVPAAGENAGDTAPDEGSTSSRDFMTVGPITFRATCSNPDADDVPGNHDPFDQEAKILAYASGPGTMSFRGEHGPRGNVPAGTGSAGLEGADGGEGKHMLLSVVRESDEGTSPEQTDSGPNVGNFSGFGTVRAYVVHTNGTELLFEGYAGVDTLGAGTPTDDADDRCVFGGTVTAIATP